MLLLLSRYPCGITDALPTAIRCRECYILYSCPEQTIAASDGGHYFLHPVNYRQMKHEFPSGEAHFPARLRARVLDVDSLSQTEHSASRFRFVSHLPEGSPLTFCLLDLAGAQPPVLSKVRSAMLFAVLFELNHGFCLQATIRAFASEMDNLKRERARRLRQTREVHPMP